MRRLINYYYQIRYRLLRNYWLRKSKYSKINGLALMYHHITDEAVNANESCKCKISVFKQTLRRLKLEGYKFVPLQKALDIINQKSNLKFVIVTFDDVPDNVYFNAFPILQELQIPFTLFVTTSFIDKSGFLSLEQLKKMASNSLCTVGAHTVTHPMLKKVKNCKEEMEESKKHLEQQLGKKVDYLAYPFGRQSSVSCKVMRQAKLIGFKCAFGTIQVPISDTSSKNLYYLPRVVIN